MCSNLVGNRSVSPRTCVGGYYLEVNIFNPGSSSLFQHIVFLIIERHCQTVPSDLLSGGCGTYQCDCGTWISEYPCDIPGGV